MATIRKLQFLGYLWPLVKVVWNRRLLSVAVRVSEYPKEFVVAVFVLVYSIMPWLHMCMHTAYVHTQTYMYLSHTIWVPAQCIIIYITSWVLLLSINLNRHQGYKIHFFYLNGSFLVSKTDTDRYLDECQSLHCKLRSLLFTPSTACRQRIASDEKWMWTS